MTEGACTCPFQSSVVSHCETPCVHQLSAIQGARFKSWHDISEEFPTAFSPLFPDDLATTRFLLFLVPLFRVSKPPSPFTFHVICMVVLDVQQYIFVCAADGVHRPGDKRKRDAGDASEHPSQRRRMSGLGASPSGPGTMTVPCLPHLETIASWGI